MTDVKKLFVKTYGCQMNVYDSERMAEALGAKGYVTTDVVEEADMVRGGKLRALAVLSEKPLNLRGYGEVPAITNWLKDFKTGPNYFGIYLPKGVPQEVVATMNQAWEDVVMKSQKLKDYALDRGAIFDPRYGEDAQKATFTYYQPVAWLYYEAGKAKVSPDTLGIPKP